MISGPVMVQVLEGENAIAKNRDLMGATDPKKAAQGTIRADFAAVDRRQRGARLGRRRRRAHAEIAYFFPALASLSAAEIVTSPRDQPARPRSRPRWTGFFAGHRREAVSRPAGAEVDPPALRRRFRGDDRSREAAAREARRDRDGAARRRSSATRPPPTARASGCSRSGNGNAVEAVFIPEDDRGTLCISSQAGCALDCAFCSTGKQGFNRNLTTAEIIGQLWLANRRCSRTASRAMDRTGGRRSRNVVMMGMGEPLVNFDNVIPALRLMLDDNAYGLSRRRVTLSTSGVVPRWTGCATNARWRSPCRCTRRTTRCATAGADQPQVSAARADGRLPAISSARRATSSRSST